SLRAAALSVNDRRENRDVLKADVDWLVKAHVGGAYTYDDRYTNPPGQRTGAAGLTDARSGELAGDTPLATPLLGEDGRPIQLADGRHDPRTGRELDPRPRATMPP